MLFLLLQWSAVLLCVCFCFFFIFESGRPLSLFLTSPSPLSLSLSLSLSFLHSCLIGVIYVAWWPTRRESTLQTLYSFFSLSFSLFFFHPLHLHHPFSVGILLLSASVASVCLPVCLTARRQAPRSVNNNGGCGGAWQLVPDTPCVLCLYRSLLFITG